MGGYLVCLGNRVTLGQATPDARVDVPLYADVSRHHATVTRDSEGYLLEGLRPERDSLPSSQAGELDSASIRQYLPNRVTVEARANSPGARSI